MVLRSLVVYMSAVVIYDSFKHATPLYYILFYFSGLVIGRIYHRLLHIKHTKPNEEIILKGGKWDIAISLILVLFRHTIGIEVLEFEHFVWAADALYLIYIGIYRSKWKGIVRQIDDVVYKFISK